MSSKLAVFLDRDGVINPYHYNTDFGTVDSPSTPEQFALLPGAAEAIADLNRQNFAVIVVSNQPGVAKGKFTPRLLQAITLTMVKQLADSNARLDDVLYCTHHPHATLPECRVDCGCRKPKPGMLLRAARERALDLLGSFLVGDGVDDMLAGRAAGVTTILLGGRRCAVCEEFASRGARPDRIARDLPQAVQEIIALRADRLRMPSRQFAVDPCLLTGNGVAHARRKFAQTERPETAGQMERIAELVRAVRERAAQ